MIIFIFFDWKGGYGVIVIFFIYRGGCLTAVTAVTERRTSFFTFFAPTCSYVHIYIAQNTRICRRGNFRSRLRGSSSAVRPSVRRCMGRHARTTAVAAGTPLDGARSPAVLNNACCSASRRGAAHASDVASPLDLSINPLGRRRRRRI